MTRSLVLLGLLAGVSASLPAALAQEAVAPPPSTTKRADIYDEKADARATIARAVARARSGQKRALLMFGGNWCGWCHKLHAVFEGDKKVAGRLRNEFVLTLVDTAAPNAESVMDELGVDRTKGVPYLVVLDHEGKPVARQETGSLEESDHHDPAKVLAFLEAQTPEPAVARSVLDTALARARADNKKVLLHFGAPWCGWCHRLEDFLARPEIAERIGRDYVEVMVDTERMKGGQDLLDEFCKKPGGIPWIVILDPDGHALATSDSEKGNIGYPVEAHEIGHFRTMLQGTASSLEKADLDLIESILAEQARAIRAPASAAR